MEKLRIEVCVCVCAHARACYCLYFECVHIETTDNIDFYTSKYSKELEWMLVRRMRSSMLETKDKKVNLSLSVSLL